LSIEGFWPQRHEGTKDRTGTGFGHKDTKTRRIEPKRCLATKTRRHEGTSRTDVWPQRHEDTKERTGTSFGHKDTKTRRNKPEKFWPQRHEGTKDRTETMFPKARRNEPGRRLATKTRRHEGTSWNKVWPQRHEDTKEQAGTGFVICYLIFGIFMRLPWCNFVSSYLRGYFNLDHHRKIPKYGDGKILL